MIARATGGALMVLGAALAALPAFAWFAAPGPAAETRASGFTGAGQLWLLPVPALIIVLCGAGLVAARPGSERAVARWAGPAATLAGAVAFGLVLWAAIRPSLGLVVRIAGATERISAPIHLQPAAVLAAVLAGFVVGIGAATSLAGWRR